MSVPENNHVSGDSAASKSSTNNPDDPAGPTSPAIRRTISLLSAIGLVLGLLGGLWALVALTCLTVPEEWMRILGMYRVGAAPKFSKPYLLVHHLLVLFGYVLLVAGAIKARGMKDAGRLLLAASGGTIFFLGVVGLCVHLIWLTPQAHVYAAAGHVEQTWKWLSPGARHWWAVSGPIWVDSALILFATLNTVYGLVALITMKRRATIAAFHAYGNETYTIGTLRYSMSSLFILFGWLLWGDFCFQIMETVIPHIFPLYMQKLPDEAGPGLGASAKLTTLFYMTIPSIFGIILGPVVAFKSDRHRGKWGRRIPYIFWTIPLMVIPLIGLGFSEDYHQYFQTSSIPRMLGIEPLTATLTVIGIFMVIFCFGNEFVNTVFWFLYADTVPKQFLARFLSLFRMVTHVALMLFNFFLVPYMLVGMKWVYLGCAILYGVGFTLMCLFVKEGEYPPPEKLEETTKTGIMGNIQSIWIQIKTYIVQCFRYKIYWATYAFTIISACAGAASIGMGVFTLQALHISLKVSGPFSAGFGLIGILLAYPCGWIADRFSPMRALVVLSALSAPLSILSFFFLQDLHSWVIFAGVNVVVGGLLSAASAPFTIIIFPRDKYGQFASCNGMMKSLSRLVIPLLGAAFIDYMVTNPDGSKNIDNYRWSYMWTGIANLLAWASLVWVFILWKKHGGENYVAPGSSDEAEMLAKQAQGLAVAK